MLVADIGVERRGTCGGRIIVVMDGHMSKRWVGDRNCHGCHLGNNFGSIDFVFLAI